VKPSDAWEALFRAQVSIMRDLRREFTDVGMSMNEYDVLFNTYRAPEHRIRLRELNSSVLITQSSVSRLVDRLVARGFMVKLEDELDARGRARVPRRRRRAHREHQLARGQRAHRRRTWAAAGDLHEAA
jgi:DNA-binding MarR family transcriptional regulator